jgi:serine/threonine-protein kinase
MMCFLIQGAEGWFVTIPIIGSSERTTPSAASKNVAAIYELEEAGGQTSLVLEFVEGETLQDRLKRGALALEEALVIAKQVAEGLEAAHDRGIVHRDLKPANIKITPDGRAKILDFGLAKMLEPDRPNLDPSNSPTLSIGRTQGEVILGTAAYMSP